MADAAAGSKKPIKTTRKEETTSPEEEAVKAKIADLNKQYPDEPKRPDYNAMQAAQQSKKDEIAKLQAERQNLRDAISNDIKSRRNRGGGGDSGALRTLLDSRDSVDRNIGALISEVGQLTQAIRRHDREKREARQQFSKLKSGAAADFNTVEDLEAEIKRLEGSLETEGSSSIKRERRLMNTIKELEASKNIVRQQQLEEARLEKKEEERSEWMTKLQEASEKLNKAREQKIEAQADITKQREENNKQNQNDEEQNRINANKAKSDNLKVQIDNGYTKLKEIADEYYAQNKVWKEWKDGDTERKVALRELQNELRKLTNARRQAERDEKEKSQRREEMAEKRLELQNPYAEQIGICNQLIAYFEGMQRQDNRPKTTVRPTTKTTKGEDEPYKAELFGKKAGKILKKDDDEEDWLFGSKKKKKAATAAQKKQEDEALGIERKAQKQNRVIHLTMTRMRAFSEIDMDPPRNTDDIPKTLGLLREKRTFYEGKQRTEEEVDKMIEENINKQNAQD